MKIKAKAKGGLVKVKVLAKHDMMTYDQAAKKFGDKNKANFIEHMSASINGETVFEASVSQFISKNPIFKYSVKGIGAKGDKLTMTWTDRSGKTKTDTAKIK